MSTIDPHDTPKSATWSLFCYVLAIGIASGANFIATPLLLACLGSEQFARWSLIEPIIVALIPFAGFGISFGLMHTIVRSESPERAFGALLPFQLAACLAGGLLAGFVALSVASPVIAIFCAAIVFAEGTIALHLTFWRACNRPGHFALIEGARAAAVAGMLALSWGYFPSLITTLSAYLLIRLVIGFAAVGAGTLLISPAGRGEWQNARAAMQFGLPIVCASVLVSLTTTLDRYAVAQFGNAAAITSYVAHVKLVQVIGSALAPFFVWFAPIVVRRLPEGRAAFPFFVTSVYLFQAINGCVTLGMWFLAPLIWQPLFGSILFDGDLFAVLLIGQMIYGLGNPVSIGTMRAGKTWQALVAAATTLIATIGFCLALGYLFGVIGVSWGRVLGFVTYTFVLGAGTAFGMGVQFHWVRMLLVKCFVAAIMIATMGSTEHLSTASGVVLATVSAAGALLFAILLHPSAFSGVRMLAKSRPSD